MLKTSRIPPLALAAAALLALGIRPALAATVTNVRTYGVKERKGEVGLTVEVDVDYGDAAKLERCLAGLDRRVSAKTPAAKMFRGLRWPAKELSALRTCRAKHCKFELSREHREKIEAASGDDAKKQAFYEAMKDLSIKAAKKRKPQRSEHYEVARTEHCGKHKHMHWLLNGPLKSWDRIIWRQVSYSSRMRQTLMTMQMLRWKHEGSYCIGRTLLKANHYYYDNLELTEIAPAGANKIRLRQHVRAHFDFLYNSWWARRAKGKIRDAMGKQILENIKRWVRKCAK